MEFNKAITCPIVALLCSLRDHAWVQKFPFKFVPLCTPSFLHVLDLELGIKPLGHIFSSPPKRVLDFTFFLNPYPILNYPLDS